MITITFPDGSAREYNKGISSLEVAEQISPRLAKEVYAATVNGEIWDLTRPINIDANLKLHKWEDAEAKHAFWHSSAHLMAEALESDRLSKTDSIMMSIPEMGSQSQRLIFSQLKIK